MEWDSFMNPDLFKAVYILNMRVYFIISMVMWMFLFAR